MTQRFRDWFANMFGRNDYTTVDPDEECQEWSNSDVKEVHDDSLSRM